MKQSETFLAGEGAAWLERNRAKLPVENDPLLEALKGLNLNSPRSLEIGCSNGWRVNKMRDEWRWGAYGIDPCIAASEGWLYRGVASDLSAFSMNAFDVVIYGFCLYLCDPEDHFKIAAEGDRVLADGGYLVIYDFDVFKYPSSRVYKHKDGVFSHKMRWENLWLRHPSYSRLSQHLMGAKDDMTAVTIIKKDMANAFPVEE